MIGAFFQYVADWRNAALLWAISHEKDNSLDVGLQVLLIFLPNKNRKSLRLAPKTERQELHKNKKKGAQVYFFWMLNLVTRKILWIKGSFI